MPICIISAFYTLMRYAYQKKHKMIDEQSTRDETAVVRLWCGLKHGSFVKGSQLCREASFELFEE